jgi:hypothetical protein
MWKTKGQRMLINKNIVKGPVGKDGKYTADQEGMLLQTHKRKDNCNTRLKMILLITNLVTGLSSPAFGKTKHEEEDSAQRNVCWIITGQRRMFYYEHNVAYI